MDRYKKKPLRFSGIGVAKAIRAHEHYENRKSSRSELYNTLRNIPGKDDSLVSPYTEEKKQVKKPVEKQNVRIEQLRKWQEEKLLKKKLEQSKRPPFVVGGTVQTRYKPITCNSSKITQPFTASFNKSLKQPFASGVNKTVQHNILPNSSRIVNSVKQVHKTGIPKYASKIPSSKPMLKKIENKENMPVVENSKYPKIPKPAFGFSQKPTIIGLSKKESETVKSTKECFHENKKNEESLLKSSYVNVTSRRKSFAPLDFQFEPELLMGDISMFIPNVQPPKIDTDLAKVPASEKEASSKKLTEECSPKLENREMNNIGQKSKVVSKHEDEKNNIEDSKTMQCVRSKPPPSNLPVLGLTKCFDANLSSINEEAENLNAEIMCTPKLKSSDAAFTVRRSLRLMKLSDESSPFKNSPTVNSWGTPAPIVLHHSNLTQDFDKLRLDLDKVAEVPKASGNSHPSLDIGEDVLNQPMVREKMPSRKVSLLYTPEAKGRYSLRKSVRGDLISFS